MLSLREQILCEAPIITWVLPDERRHHHINPYPSMERREAAFEAEKASYTPEEAWQDQVAQLPTEEQVRILTELLRPAELRELAAGLIIDAVAGCKSKSLLDVAESVNGWVATAEELSASRRKLRHILAAKERMRSQSEGIA